MTVSATTPSGSTVEFGPVTTDSMGEYTLPIDSGTYDIHFVPPSGSGYQPVVESNYTITTSQTLDVQFAPTPRTFSGTLTDSTNAPQSGVSVILSASPWAGSNAAGSATTDSNGYFNVTASAGTYYLTVIGNSRNPSYEFSQNSPGIDLTSGNVTQDLQLKTAVVQVSVKYADGSAASGIPVLGNAVTGSTTLYPGDPGMTSGGALTGTIAGCGAGGLGGAIIGAPVAGVGAIGGAGLGCATGSSFGAKVGGLVGAPIGFIVGAFDLDGKDAFEWGPDQLLR